MEAGPKRVLSTFDEGTARLAARSVAHPPQQPGGPDLLGRDKACCEARLATEYSLQEDLERRRRDRRPLAPVREKVVRPLAQLWGVTVKLETHTEDRRVVPVHECRMEPLQRRVAGAAATSASRGFGR